MVDKFFVDRIADGTIFCEDEDGKEIKFGLSQTNGVINEGDVVFKDANGSIKTDLESTSQRKQEISNLKKVCIQHKNIDKIKIFFGA